MLLQLLKDFFSNEIMHALSWTLMHSLWQGILLAAIATIILYQTKKANAGIRYKLFCGLLAMLIIGCFCTFFYELSLSVQNISVISAQTNVTNAIISNNVEVRTGFIDRMIAFFQSWEYLIVPLYFLMLTIKSIKMLAGFRIIYILKNRQVYDAGKYWNAQMLELSAKVGITRPVILLRSAIVKVPMVIGYFKPVILFPVSAITTLATEEIEAILLHELAHIRRKDYLVNIMQNFAEIIFFFNPAVLWISSLIKNERENCCDDIAISQTKNKKQFIHALVSFQEYNLSINNAASFAGKRGQLLNRVKRIITNNNKTLNNMEKILLASGIIITSLVAAVIPQNKQADSFQPASIDAAKNIAVTCKLDSLPPATTTEDENKMIFNSSIDGKKYRLIKLNGKVSELYENDSRIPDDKLADYKTVISKIESQFDAQKALSVEQLKAQVEAMQLRKDAMKEQTKAIKSQAAELAKQAEVISKVDQLKMQNELSAAKALAMDAQVKSLKQNEALQALENLKELSKVRATIDETEAIKQSKELMETQMGKLQELQQSAAEIQAKAELMQQDKQMMNEQMQKQIEDLKRSQQDLINQNKALRDSLNQIRIKPNSVVKHFNSDVVVR